MKKHTAKSRVSSHINKAPKFTPKNQDDQLGLDDSSLDQIFRFDDKLIGKRTNTIFDVKPADDGFYDIIQENFNSQISFESSSIDCNSSSSILENFHITQAEENKNQKMIRYIRQSQNPNIIDESLSEINEDDYIEDGSSKITTTQKSLNPEKSQHKHPKKQEAKPQKPEKKAQKYEKGPLIAQKPGKNQAIVNPQTKPQKDDKKDNKKGEKPIEKKNEKDAPIKQRQKITQKPNANEKIIQKSAKVAKEKKVEEKDQPTAEKKSHVIESQKVQDLNALYEAKSKPRSEENPKEAKQKIEVLDQGGVKIEKKFQNKAQIQEKRQEEKQKNDQKNHQDQSFVPKQKTEGKKMELKKFEPSKRRLEHENESRKRGYRSQIPEEFKIETNNPGRRRIPRAGDDNEQERILLKKLKIQLQIEKPGKNEEYEPFGRMGLEGRYPKRLRIPPLRFWINERRQYERGLLSGITLIDDSQGRRLSKIIEAQINDEEQI